MSYNQQKTLSGFDGVSETNVDDALEQRPALPPKKKAWSEHQYDVNAVRSPQPQYDELSPPPIPSKPWNNQAYDTKPTKYEDLPPKSPKTTYDTLESNDTPTTSWSGQQYDVNAVRSPKPMYDELANPNDLRHSSTPWAETQYYLKSQGHQTPPISPDDYIQIATTLHEMEAERERKLFQEIDGINTNPLYSTGDYIEVSQATSAPAKPIHSPSYFQRFKTFVWSNAQRRIATVVITSLVIGGIIGAYLGISSASTSSTSSPDTRHCTYPEGVNATFTQLQETLATGNSSLSIPGLDHATCSLISMVINNTVSALKMGGYNCWQNVQSALMPLASSAIALNMDSIGQIITSVKQYCFPSSSTAMTSSVPITSPANTLTTIKTTPMTSEATTITTTTTTTSAGTTAVRTTTPAPTTVMSMITSSSSTMIQTTTTSLLTTSTGTTTTLTPLTTTNVPAGTTTITTTPMTSTTLFVSSSTSTTIQTMTTTPTSTTTTTLIPCCPLNTCLSYYPGLLNVCGCQYAVCYGPCSSCWYCTQKLASGCS